MKNKKRLLRRMATLRKIAQRKRFLHYKLGSPTYWSHYSQKCESTWEQRTYNRMKNQFPFSGDFRREKKEYNRFGRDKRKIRGDEGFDGAEPDCKPCHYCGKFKEIKVGDVCETCMSYLDDLVFDNFYQELGKWEPEPEDQW